MHSKGTRTGKLYRLRSAIDIHTRTLRSTVDVLQDGLQAVTATSSAPAKSKGKTAGSQVSISIDEEWVASHAEQVQRMLPGGELLPHACSRVTYQHQ